MSSAIGLTNGVTTRPLFSISGAWIAFVTSDLLVWKPDSTLLGHLIDDDIFAIDGAYIGSMKADVFTRLDEKANLNRPRGAAPVVFPGYPGIPEPSLIRPLQPGETLQAKLILG